MPVASASEWESFISSFTEAHILQTSAWGELKSSFGWQVERVIIPRCSNEAEGRESHLSGTPIYRCGAQILFRRLPGGFSFAYLPKGPVGEDWEGLWPEVDAICRKHRAIFLKVEPDLWENACADEKGVSLAHKNRVPPPGFRLSRHSIQPPRTLVVDLRGEEADILTRMRQKTRYNIRLALKKGIIVRSFSDVELFHRLMQVTGQRDQFEVHSLAYYQRAYELFHPRGECVMLLAEYLGEPLGALMVFARGQRAWYFYGASLDSHRERMPTYLLQWEAMRWARAQRCVEYDLWGVPDADEATLEANFTRRSDGLWGVYRFKRGFGGQLRRAVGPWDRVYQPALYRLYTLWLRWTGRGG